MALLPLQWGPEWGEVVAESGGDYRDGLSDQLIVPGFCKRQAGSKRQAASGQMIINSPGSQQENTLRENAQKCQQWTSG